jgi:hypothetical protein
VSTESILKLLQSVEAIHQQQHRPLSPQRERERDRGRVRGGGGGGGGNSNSNSSARKRTSFSPPRD